MRKKEEIVNPVNLALRVDASLRSALEREAAAMGLTLSAYIKHLLHTHPKRQGKK